MSVSDMDMFTLGELTDIIIENNNIIGDSDDEEYFIEATQEDFDKF